MKIGERIKSLRQHNNMTQLQLAEAVFISQQAINKIEHDVTKPSLELAQRIAKAFGCTIDDLVEDEAV